jgi:hypothetical protein
MVDRVNPYHLSGNAMGDGVRAMVDGLVAGIKEATAASGPEAKRAAALAVTNLQQGAMWARKAFTSEDFVAGDERPDLAERDGQSDP